MQQIKLNKKLKNTSFDDAVWRSLDNSGAPDSFIWSGENEDADRNQAAKKLCDKIINLTQQVPNCRIHFIAHSHGGNVALKAIELYYKKLSEGVDLLVWYIYKNNNDTQALEEIIDQYFSQVDQESILSVIEKNQENLKKASDYNFLVKYPKLLLQGHNIRKRIKDDIKQISNINRMGEVIFLGTPFYRKQNKKNSEISKYIKFIINGLPIYLIPFVGLMYYVMIEFYGWLLSLMFSAVQNPSINPFGWPIWLFYTWVGLSIVGLSSFLEEQDKNVNVYFNTEKFDSLGAENSPSSFKINSLVVTASSLDEALLGLSAKPFVYATIMPRLIAFLHKKPRWPEWRKSFNSFSNFIGTPIQLIITIIYYLVSPAWYIVRKYIVLPFISDIIMSTITDTAYGLDSNNYKQINISIQDCIYEPKFFDIWKWDITQDILNLKRNSTKYYQHTVEEPNYDHISDSKLLNTKILDSLSKDKSFWKSLDSQIPTLYKEYTVFVGNEPESLKNRMMTEDEFKTELAKNWFTLEERVKEIELVHSLYYTNDNVIECIAKFLSDGNPPIEAKFVK